MWSVWSEFVFGATPIHVHLGRGYALVRGKGQATQVLHFPEDLPMDRILSRVSDALHAKFPSRWKRKPALHVTLGATLCRPLGFAVPAALQSWQELQLVVNAQAAQTIQIQGMPPNAICCALSYEQAGLAGVVNGETLDQIQAWATQHQLHLVSIAPLWSIASACTAAQAKNVQAIAVHEPEGCTLLMVSANAPPQAITLPPVSDADNSRALLNRHWMSMGVTESAVLHMHFATLEQASLKALPAIWSGHWSMR